MSQLIYMVVRQNKEGTTDIRTGGGSSAPEAVHAYDSLKKAQAYIKNKDEKHYIKIIDLDAQENRV